MILISLSFLCKQILKLNNCEILIVGYIQLLYVYCNCKLTSILVNESFHQISFPLIQEISWNHRDLFARCYFLMMIFSQVKSTIMYGSVLIKVHIACFVISGCESRSHGDETMELNM